MSSSLCPDTHYLVAVCLNDGTSHWYCETETQFGIAPYATFAHAVKGKHVDEVVFKLTLSLHGKMKHAHVIECNTMYFTPEMRKTLNLAG